MRNWIETDARFGVDVFWKGFLSNRTGYRMGVPVVPLAELYDGCKAEIERRGGEVNLRMPMRAIHCSGWRRWRAWNLMAAARRRRMPTFSPCRTRRWRSCCPTEIKQEEPSLAHLENIKVSPITGVHFWFDREVMQEPFVTLLETTTQWIFNKTALYDAKKGSGKEKGQYLQLVISASYELLQKPRQEIIDLCLAEVRQALPAAREAKLLKATVIKEAAATFSPQPGVDRWRPKQQTSIRSMFLAGDWTATGWPATMEGAVRSGYLAAEAVLRVAGTPKGILQPDLLPDGLVWMFVK